jgi:hypothetical protein
VNPGFEWKIAPGLNLDGQLNWTKSHFHRESPTVLPITRGSSGITVEYTNGDVPTIASNVNLNDPNNFIWDGGRVNHQEELRDTETKGGRANLTWGDAAFNVKAGAAYDDISRAHPGQGQLGRLAGRDLRQQPERLPPRTQRRAALQRREHAGRERCRPVPRLRHGLHGRPDESAHVSRLAGAAVGTAELSHARPGRLRDARLGPPAARHELRPVREHRAEVGSSNTRRQRGLRPREGERLLHRAERHRAAVGHAAQVQRRRAIRAHRAAGGRPSSRCRIRATPRRTC